MNRKKILALALMLAASPALMATNIIPYPAKLEQKSGTFDFGKSIEIASDSKSKSTATYLAQELAKSYGEQASLVNGKAEVMFIEKKSLPSEAYELSIDGDGVKIAASSNTGWFYGVQSLIQLIDFKESGDMSAQQVEIEDQPRFEWRAWMLDEARHFKGMDEVKMMLDEMAHLKMNVFHWHLIDDQGWRVEIKKYPLLTEVGAKRTSTQVGPLKWQSPMQSGEPHEGFYTQEQIKEIVQYAADRHITIIPEIEMPGHSCAAIAAYPWLGTVKKPIDVPVTFGVSADVYDVSDPKVFDFLTDVLDEVMELFPSKVIHIGGDEVRYTHWENSPAIQKYMKDNDIKSYAHLQVDFTNKISQYIESKGRRMMGWNEILGHNLHEYQVDTKPSDDKLDLAPNSVIHFWKGDLNIAKEAAENNFTLVNSNHFDTYLDYNYQQIPLSRAYAFNPIPEGLPEEYHDNVIGSGCQMWSEWIPTRGEMHFMVFPRIAAYAEVGWSELDRKNYERFREALPELQERWKSKGIHFAPDNVVEPEKK